MKTQADLLARKAWNVLIILDACRADKFSLFIPATPTVKSLGTCTPDWLRVFFSGGFVGPHYHLSWNPHTAREWKTHSSICPGSVLEFAPADDVTGRVEPDEINARALKWLDTYGQPAQMVVHFQQPHAPYGKLPKQPPRSYWPAQYVSNLLWGLRAVWQLLPHLRGNVVVTADHGELLGEPRGKTGRSSWGHGSSALGWTSDRLWDVPWLDIYCGKHYPAPLPSLEQPEMDGEQIHERLRALGYE